jgi:hypothetical protein
MKKAKTPSDQQIITRFEQWIKNYNLELNHSKSLEVWNLTTSDKQLLYGITPDTSDFYEGLTVSAKSRNDAILELINTKLLGCRWLTDQEPEYDDGGDSFVVPSGSIKLPDFKLNVTPPPYIDI